MKISGNRKLGWLFVAGLLVGILSAQVPQTPNLGLNLPPQGYPNWGPMINQNFIILDSAMWHIDPGIQIPWPAATCNNPTAVYVPSINGCIQAFSANNPTFTGTLTGPSASFGSLSVAGNPYVPGLPVNNPAFTGTMSGPNINTPKAQINGSTILYPEWYGAVGDGSHDDTSAFNAMSAACPPNSCSMHLSAKTYLLKGQWTVTGSGRSVIGEGRGATTINCLPTATINACLQMMNTGLGVVRDLTISANSFPTYVLEHEIGGSGTSAENQDVMDVLLSGGQNGWAIGPNTALDLSHVNGFGVKVDGAAHNNIVVGNGVQANVLDANCYGCTSDDAGEWGLKLNGGDMSIHGGGWDSNQKGDFYYAGQASAVLSIIGVRAEESPQFFYSDPCGCVDVMRSVTMLDDSWTGTTKYAPAQYVVETYGAHSVTIINSFFAKTSSIADMKFQGTNGSANPMHISMTNVGMNNQNWAQRLLQLKADPSIVIDSTGDYYLDQNMTTHPGSGLNIHSNTNVMGGNFSTDPSGNLTSHGNISTPAGGMGNYQNLVKYSKFDPGSIIGGGSGTTTSPWYHFCDNSPPVFTSNTPDTTDRYGTHTALKWVGGSATDPGCYVVGTLAQHVVLTPGQTYTTCFWAKGAAGGESIGYGFESSAGSDANSQVVANLTTSWWLYSVTATVPSTGWTGSGEGAVVVAHTVNGIMYFADWQTLPGTTCGPYAHSTNVAASGIGVLDQKGDPILSYPGVTPDGNGGLNSGNVTSSGNVSAGNVSASGSVSGQSFSGQSLSVTGNVSSQSVNAVLNATAYATGSSTGGIKEAYAALPSTGGKITLGGNITISAAQTLTLVAGKPLTLDQNGFTIFCTNPSGACLTVDQAISRTPTVWNDGLFDGAGAGAGATGLYYKNAENITLGPIMFAHFNKVGSTALILDWVEDSTVNVQTQDDYNGVVLQNATNENVFTFRLNGAACPDYNGVALSMNGSDGNLIHGLIQDNCGTKTVIIGDDSTRVKFENMWFESNGDRTSASRLITLNNPTGWIQNLAFVNSNFAAGTAGANGYIFTANNIPHTTPILMENNYTIGYVGGWDSTGGPNRMLMGVNEADAVAFSPSTLWGWKCWDSAGNCTFNVNTIFNNPVTLTGNMTGTGSIDLSSSNSAYIASGAGGFQTRDGSPYAWSKWGLFQIGNNFYIRDTVNGTYPLLCNPGAGTTSSCVAAGTLQANTVVSNLFQVGSNASNNIGTDGTSLYLNAVGTTYLNHSDNAYVTNTGNLTVQGINSTNGITGYQGNFIQITAPAGQWPSVTGTSGAAYDLAIQNSSLGLDFGFHQGGQLDLKALKFNQLASTLSSGTTANTDMQGSLALSGATSVSYTFNGSYTIIPLCRWEMRFNAGTATHWDTSSITQAQITFSSAVTGTVSYFCTTQQ